MPQLEFATYASQIFWLAVTFCILYFVMARNALPVIREVVQNRQTRISEDLKKAEKLKQEAESTEADFTSAVVSARQKASSFINEARTKADKEAAKRQAGLDETFARQAKDAEHRVEVIKKEAREKLLPVTIDFASEALKKLANVEVDRKTIEGVVLKLEQN